MTIKNALASLALSAASRVAPPLGQDWVFDFSAIVVEDTAFSLRFDEHPVGVAFSLDFSAATYRVAPVNSPYGRYMVDSGLGDYGTLRIGLDDVVLNDGFSFDFALWVEPADPTGFENVTLHLDFTTPRYVVETYPPPIGLVLDFSDVPVLPAFLLDFSEDAYQEFTGADTWGRYQENTDTFDFTGTPLRTPAAFTLEQAVPGVRSRDDRLGHFTLGYTTLGAFA